MNDTTYTDNAPPPETIDEEALRKRLVNRIAIAGVVIVALLGGLAVIDTLYVAPPAPTPKLPAPQPISEVIKPIDAVAASATVPEPPQPEAVPTIKSAGEPEETTSPAMPVAKETQGARPLGKIVEPRIPAGQTAPSRPLTQPVKAAPEVQRFVLQMGVFNNVDNAQELLAKLQKGGVPAQIEARVQVGPFKTQKETDEARVKLKAMGLDAGLLIATHR